MPIEYVAPAEELATVVRSELDCYRARIGRTEVLTTLTTERVSQGDAA